jgi:hypothetical protein
MLKVKQKEKKIALDFSPLFGILVETMENDGGTTMITGNMTLSSRPSLDELRGDGICGSCLCECQEVGVDNSFSDSFGYVTDWGRGSDCCEAEVFEGRIFLDETSTHTARKHHKDGRVKAGERYRQNVRKGYYIDDSGNHHGIFEITKKVLTSA